MNSSQLQYTPNNDSNNICTSPIEDISNPITYEELDRAITMIKENKSPGLDGLDISILKIPEITDYLLALFNRCLIMTGRLLE